MVSTLSNLFYHIPISTKEGGGGFSLSLTNYDKGFLKTGKFQEGPLSCSIGKRRRSVSKSKNEYEYPKVRVVPQGKEEDQLSPSKPNWGEPISLGTAALSPDIDLRKLENYLYQWGSSLTQNANLPLPVPLKVDKINGGVRLAYVRVTDEGLVEELVHIDCLIASDESKPIFRALRSGRFKDMTPPGEAEIMQSLLQALKKSIQLSKA